MEMSRRNECIIIHTNMALVVRWDVAIFHIDTPISQFRVLKESMPTAREAICLIAFDRDCIWRDAHETPKTLILTFSNNFLNDRLLLWKSQLHCRCYWVNIVFISVKAKSRVCVRSVLACETANEAIAQIFSRHTTWRWTLAIIKVPAVCCTVSWQDV